MRADRYLDKALKLQTSGNAMKNRSGATFVIALIPLLASCAHIAGKTVVRKDGPNILVANDGSICVVSQERFDKTEIGMKVLCGWRGAGIPQPRMRPASPTMDR